MRPPSQHPGAKICAGRALVGAVALAACQSPAAESGTGLRVSSAWSGAQIDQLEFLVTTSSGATVHPAERRPEVAGGPLASGVDVVILLPDHLGGQRIRCEVVGYSGGLAMRRGEVPVDLVTGSVTTVAVTLAGGAPPGVDGGAGGAKEIGQRCNAARDCASGNCVGGICCDTPCSGACQACAIAGKEGTCGVVPAGTADGRCRTESAISCGFDGTCGPNGACRKYVAGTVCVPGACSGNTVVAGSRCDGSGACVPSASRSCGAFTCDPAAGGCKTSCTSNGDCVAPASCSGGLCGTFRSLGQPCASAGECASGSCVDGVCCSTASCGLCLACNVPGRAGSCQPVPDGMPEPRRLCPVQPIAMCGSNGNCNGAGGCAVYPEGTMCRPGKTCSSGVCR